MDNWNYPPGADAPDAPWNQPDEDEDEAEDCWICGTGRCRCDEPMEDTEP